MRRRGDAVDVVEVHQGEDDACREADAVDNPGGNSGYDHADNHFWEKLGLKSTSKEKSLGVSNSRQEQDKEDCSDESSQDCEDFRGSKRRLEHLHRREDDDRED